MKTLLRLIGIVVVSLVGVAIVLAIAGASGQSATVASPQGPTKLYAIDQVQWGDDRTIIGQFRNFRSRNLGMVSIHFDLYTANGAKVGEVSDFIGSLGAGERWIFQAHIPSRYGPVSYRVGEIHVDGRLVDVPVSFKEDENKPTPEKAKAIAEAERERAEEGLRIKAAEAAAKVKRVSDAKAEKQAKIDAAVQAFRDEQRRKFEAESAPK